MILILMILDTLIGVILMRMISSHLVEFNHQMIFAHLNSQIYLDFKLWLNFGLHNCKVDYIGLSGQIEAVEVASLVWTELGESARFNFHFLGSWILRPTSTEI